MSSLSKDPSTAERTYSGEPFTPMPCDALLAVTDWHKEGQGDLRLLAAERTPSPNVTPNLVAIVKSCLLPAMALPAALNTHPGWQRF